jgi:hypothetical protein
MNTWWNLNIQVVTRYGKIQWKAIAPRLKSSVGHNAML